MSLPPPVGVKLFAEWHQKCRKATAGRDLKHAELQGTSMMNEKSYSHAGKTVRRYPVLAACALLATAIGTASCSLVEDNVFKTASADTSTINAKVEPAKKSYGYQKSGKANVVLVADGSTAPKTARTVYSGSSPYICSPSGFGQKSRCFLRP
nr:hypothetical protein [Agrobacterium tumefaciens]